MSLQDNDIKIHIGGKSVKIIEIGGEITAKTTFKPRENSRSQPAILIVDKPDRTIVAQQASSQIGINPT